MHILEKLYTNKKKFLNGGGFLCMLICVLILSACASSKKNYARPDFTDLQLFTKEIERIRSLKEKEPVRALWLATLLHKDCAEKNTDRTDEAVRLCAECAENACSAFYSFTEKKKWAQAVRIAQSMQTLYDLYKTSPYDGISAQNAVSQLARLLGDKNFKEQAEYAKNTVNTLPRVPSSPASGSIADFIRGTVTVWVDLGVKVEKGMGYASRVIGSGFFIDKRGYIITNHHVIADLVDSAYEGYGRLYIKLASDTQTRIPAKVIGWDKTLDLALLKTEVRPPFVFPLGSSENLSVGARIYAIGSPAGLESTITSGIVSSFDRNLLSTVSVMQIDAAVNAGNSGGPLVSSDGYVQGIVFAGMPDFQGLNFAVPVEYLSGILQSLYAGGEVIHSWVGAYGRTLKKTPSALEGEGVEVLYLMPGGSADYAGLRSGDVISAINGKRIKTVEELQTALIVLPPRSLAVLEYRRPEKESNQANTDTLLQSPEHKALVYLDVRDENPGKAIYEREPAYRMFYPLFGMELVPSSASNRRKFSVQTIVKGSNADESGFSVNDPVEIIRTKLLEDRQAVYAEVYTKKRKSGYLEVNLAVGAPLDSPYLF